MMMSRWLEIRVEVSKILFKKADIRAGIQQSFVSLENPKHILESKLIKYNLSLEKPKRTG